MTGLAEKMTPLTQDKFDKMFCTSKFSLLSGLHVWSKHPTLYGKAMNLYRRLRDEYCAALRQVDVLITPTTPFNASGHPAMSLPIGFLLAEDDSGIKLPVGMQIVGGMFLEEMIYRVGAAWEKAFDWETS
jgi:amidase